MLLRRIAARPRTDRRHWTIRSPPSRPGHPPAGLPASPGAA